MSNPLTRKLDHFADLSLDDRFALDDASRLRVRHYHPGDYIIHEGDCPHQVNLFLSGWACRQKQLLDGRRQIAAIFLPGDLCDHNVFILKRMDHSIACLTPVTVAELSPDVFERLTIDHPRIERALTWETLVNAAVQREWTTNLGQRSALERVAHLICELFHRLRAVGMTQVDEFDFPITQAEVAEATGISAVHVNRMLQDLRARKLIILRGRRLKILSLRDLMALGLFSADYLHLERSSRASTQSAAPAG